ncbi:ADP-ribosylglycohydrolase family protein [Olavius algarvensis spirochete endosymbiont]|uniref:ADP-ribosylglycohydrolase family protein n=1 Tax=Olavius algarvensis spirochete endosymbiont TaxID=260710 RepID=UPI00352E27AB
MYQLLHAPSLEAGVVDTIMRGGDTDTNAAICGALLGAVCGVGRRFRLWARRSAELPTRGRKSASTPPTPGMLLAGGCVGAG